MVMPTIKSFPVKRVRPTEVGPPTPERKEDNGKVYCLKCDLRVRPVATAGHLGPGSDLAYPSCGHRLAFSTLPPRQ